MPTAIQPTAPPALDQDVVNLSKAIRDVETPGGQAVSGKTGELTSRYQFMPATWKTEAGRILGDANAPLTIENENKVAYTRIKEWKDKGYGPDQIASMWNSGHPDWKGNVGVNKAGVHYDTPAYVAKVGDAYKRYKGQVQAPTEQPATPPISPTSPTEPQDKVGLPEQALRAVSGASIGAAKGFGSTVAGLSSLGEKLVGAPAAALGLKPQEAPLGEQFQKSGLLTPQGTAQKVGYVGEQVGEALLPLGAAAEATKIPRAERGITKAGELMYDVLRPSKGEIAKFELKKGRDLKEVAQAIAQQGIKPIVQDGKLSWKNGIEKMRNVVAEAGPRLQQILEKQKGKVDLAKVAEETNKNLEKMFKNASELDAAQNHVQELLLSEVERYGGTDVPKAVANQIKSGMWQVGYDAMKPLKSKVARQVGHVLSDAVGEGAPKLVKDLNKNMSLAMDAIDVMEKSTGRGLKGGRLGQKFAGIVGASALHGVPIIGPIAGYEIGQAVSKGLSESQAVRGAAKAGKLMQRAEKLGLKVPMTR